MDSELRYHQTTGEWVLIAPKRGKRHNELKKGRTSKRKPSPVNTCPFENPQKNGNQVPYFWFPSDKSLKNWRIQVVPNKFPALKHGHTCTPQKKGGIYLVTQGVGYHDLVITRDHFRSFTDLSVREATDVLLAFQKRHREVALDRCVSYVSIYCNWGLTAGATVYHPHYQIIALPVIPASIGRSISFSADYRKKKKRCIHCDIIAKEKKDRKRIIFENGSVIAFVPFAAKEPFQINIFPKKHLPYFEESSKELLKHFAEVLQKILRSVRKRLSDPDYNFFIHTAPVRDKKKHGHYHWHLELVPKSNISAGFELGTGIEINPVFPEEAAKILRG